MLTEQQIDDLCLAIESHALVCPEQVADMVFAARNLRDARKMLERCIRNDKAETRSLLN